MRSNEGLIRGAGLLLYALGFIFVWWPMACIGVLLLAFYGQWIMAILLAFLLDCFFGAPTGFLHAAIYPFTLLTTFIVVVRALTIRHLR